MIIESKLTILQNYGMSQTAAEYSQESYSNYETLCPKYL